MQIPPFSLEKQLKEIGEEVEVALLRVARSGQYIGGKEGFNFEQSFAQTIGSEHVIGCNSGTDALVLALRALGIGSGDEVITQSFSFFATAEAISIVGAKPIFVDIDERNFLLNLDSIEKAITSSTKAILPVHLFGHPVDMDCLMQLAKKNNLKVIEDCAQAVGAQWNGKSVGSFGDAGCFSFFPTKNLGAAGDAGAVATSDFEIAKRVRELSVHGMPKRYFHTEVGYNSRLDTLQAAILNVKLPNLPKWISRRNEIAEYYQELLKDISAIELPFVESEKGIQHAWNQFVIKVANFQNDSLDKDFSKKDNFGNSMYINSRSRDLFKEKLQDNGVNTIIYYPIPIHLQPAYKLLKYEIGSLPITEKLCTQVLSLPIFPEITCKEQEYVANSIRKVLNE